MLDQLNCNKKDFIKQYPWLEVKQIKKKKASKSNSILKKAVSNDQIQCLLDQYSDKNPAIKELVFGLAFNRLLKITRKMFRSYPSLHQLIEADDVLQGSLIRLNRALDQIEVKEVEHFFNLAMIQIRRELIDLTRHHLGPQGVSKNQLTAGRLDQVVEKTDNLDSWEEFHQKIDNLPDKEREVFSLIYYKDLEQLQVAGLLDVSERTVRNRWTNAKLLLSIL